MKKILIGTTALIAAGLIGGQAVAAEKIKLSVGGFMHQFVSTSDQDEDFQNATAGNYGGYNNTSNTEVHFRGSTKLDNGITFAVKIEVEGDTAQGTTVDESVLMIKSPTMGELWLGGEDMSTYTVHNTSPDASYGIDDGVIAGWWTTLPGAVTALQTTSFNPGDDDAKISYFSPKFSGFRVTGSFAGDVNKGNNVSGVTSGADEAWTVGADYSGEVNGVGVSADIYYGNRAGGYGDVTTGAAQSGYDQIGGGVSLKYAGFTLGGAYSNVDQGEDVLVDGPTSMDGDSWTVGLKYATGPYAISASYYASETEGLLADTDDDEYEIFQVSGSYSLGGGVTFVGSVFHFDYDDESDCTVSPANCNDGWGGVVGFKVGF